MYVVLSRKSSFPTAKDLAKGLSGTLNKKIVARKEPKPGDRVLVRYGNSSKYPQIGLTDYNSKELIQLLVDKKKFSEVLLEEGFIAPQFKSDTLPLQKDYPIVLRTTLTGFKGRGIVVITNIEDFNRYVTKNSFWTKFFSLSSEFRFHVGVDKNKTPRLLRVAKKIPREDDYVERRFPIRTNENYKFSLLNEPESRFPKLCSEVLSVANLLGKGFYALDVGWSRDLKRPVFLEGNSAPGLDSAGVTTYVEFLTEVIL